MPLNFGEVDIGTNSVIQLQPYQRGLTGRYPTGRVIWAEDFESPGAALNWYAVDGQRWRVARSGLRSRTGRYSLRLTTQGGLNDAHRVVSLDSTINRIGCECWWTYSNNLINATGTPFVGLAIERWNGSAYDEYQCLYSPISGNYAVNFDVSPTTVTRPQKLSPYDPSSGGGNSVISQSWHHEKLIIDIVLRKFVSLNIDNEFYDLSAIPLLVSGIKTPITNSADPNMIVLEWHLSPGSGGAGINGVTPGQLYVDDISLTAET